MPYGTPNRTIQEWGPEAWQTPKENYRPMRGQQRNVDVSYAGLKRAEKSLRESSFTHLFEASEMAPGPDAKSVGLRHRGSLSAWQANTDVLGQGMEEAKPKKRTGRAQRPPPGNRNSWRTMGFHKEEMPHNKPLLRPGPQVSNDSPIVGNRPKENFRPSVRIPSVKDCARTHHESSDDMYCAMTWGANVGNKPSTSTPHDVQSPTCAAQSPNTSAISRRAPSVPSQSSAPPSSRHGSMATSNRLASSRSEVSSFSRLESDRRSTSSHNHDAVTPCCSGRGGNQCADGGIWSRRESGSHQSDGQMVPSSRSSCSGGVAKRERNSPFNIAPDCRSKTTSEGSSGWSCGASRTSRSLTMPSSR